MKPGPAIAIAINAAAAVASWEPIACAIRMTGGCNYVVITKYGHVAHMHPHRYPPDAGIFQGLNSNVD